MFYIDLVFYMLSILTCELFYCFMEIECRNACNFNWEVLFLHQFYQKALILHSFTKNNKAQLKSNKGKRRVTPSAYEHYTHALV